MVVKQKRGSRQSESNDAQQRKYLSKLKVSNIIYPILIGLLVVGYMLWREFDIEALSQLEFTPTTFLWLFVAVLFMFGRDIGYIIRIKVLSDGEMSWAQAFRVIMLWEFTSAVTPSAVGGTSFAIIYVHKEGINIGKSSAIVLLTSFLDELYFVVMFPLLILLVGHNELFSSAAAAAGINSGIITIALTGYFLKFAYSLLVSYGLFFNPRGFKWILGNVFKLRFLRRWREDALKVGDDIIVSSAEIKNKNFIYWLKVLSSTFLSWSSRYLVVNAIMLGFFFFSDHLLLFARQLVMWIMMLVMPTPGGSGFSEYFFAQYLGDLIPIGGVAVVLALLWRLITYYPYLVIGAIMLPRWIKMKFGKNR